MNIIKILLTMLFLVVSSLCMSEDQKEKVTFTLADGLQIMYEHPDTFFMPSPSDMIALKKGDIVKLMFRIKHPDKNGELTETVERMWVILTDSDFPFFKGVLDNDPYCTDEIKSGLKLEFEAQNIIDIYDESNKT